MTDDRLRTIEARARALEWRFHNEPSGFTLTHPSDPNKVAYEIGRHHFGRWELGYTAAERLLTTYEPVTGPVVVVKNYFSAAKDYRAKLTWDVNGITSTMTGALAECYPPPGTYRLVRCEPEPNLDTEPVVVIRRATDASGNFCNTNCDLSSRTLCLHCSGHVISGPHRPKETCPGPAPVGKEWRMVLCDAPDPGAGDKGDGDE